MLRCDFVLFHRSGLYCTGPRGVGRCVQIGIEVLLVVVDRVFIDCGVQVKLLLCYW